MIGITGIVIIFPFISDLLSMVWGNQLKMSLLAVTALLACFSAVLILEALSRGKIAIIEPILSFSLPLAVLLSLFFKHEQLSVLQLFFIALTFFGVLMAIIVPGKNIRKIKFEKGVLFAILGATSMGIETFFIGVTSQETSPLLAMWVVSIFFTVLSAVVISWRKEWVLLKMDLKKSSLLIFITSVLDNLAWIFFAMATVLIPISIATTISQSYIAVAVLLGIFLNKEKINNYQGVGIILTIITIVGLSAITV